MRIARARSSFAGGLFALLLSATAAAGTELPVIFIHGFYSSAETWNETLPPTSRASAATARITDIDNR